MAARALEHRVHRLKVVLEGTRPKVWRRVEVPSVTCLCELHVLIQVVMGWNGSHLHSFEFSGRHYSENEGIGFGPPDRNEHAARVGDVLRRKGSKGVYTYDFGDDWVHLITVEEVVDAEPGAFYPRLLDGHGGGPPEDCGGVYGFEYLRHLRQHPEEITGGHHGDAEEQRDWVELLEPDELDLEAGQRVLREVFSPLPLEEEPPEPLEPVEGLASARPVSLPPDEELATAAVESSPLRELLALARWFGTGRALTSTGVPRPADLRSAAAELDLWPHASQQEAAERAERLKRLHAARNLPGFLPLWRWVNDLDLVLADSKKAVAAPEAIDGVPPGQALELWGELFDAAVDGDPDDEGPFGTVRAETDLFPPVLRLLYEVPDDAEVPLDELVTELLDNFIQVGEEAESVRLSILTCLYRGVHHLARSGAVRLNDRTPQETAEIHLSTSFMIGS